MKLTSERAYELMREYSPLTQTEFLEKMAARDDVNQEIGFLIAMLLMKNGIDAAMDGAKEACSFLVEGKMLKLSELPAAIEMATKGIGDAARKVAKMAAES